ncbi:MAG: hypothetical protein V7785_12420 [Bermanella sp.]
MKLQPGQPPPVVNSGESPAPSQVDKPQAASPEAARLAQLQKLVNTWAKVESSQWLNSDQSRQALENMPGKVTVSGQTQTPAQGQPQANKPVVVSPQGQSSAVITGEVVDSQVPIKVPSNKLATQATPSPAQTLPPDKQLALITLNTQQGLITILSTRLHDKGSQLLIQQNAQGQWQFQTPARLMSLTAIAHQYNELSVGTASLKFNDPQASVQSQSSKASLPMEPPKSLLDATQSLDVKLIKQAIEQSGQFFEQKLLKSASAELPQTKPATSIDLNQRLQKVESQIQKWINALPIKLNAKSPNQAPGDSSITAIKVSENQEGALKLNPQINKSVSAEETQASNTQKNSSNDNKAWLIKLQMQLFKEWQATPKGSQTQAKNQFSSSQDMGSYSNLKNGLYQNTNLNIPKTPSQSQSLAKPLINWFEGMSQQSSSTDSLNNEKTNNLLEWLLAPKAAPSEKALPVWPSNLSAQVQVHKLLQNIMLQVQEGGDTESEGPEKILRQLLQVSQSLTRIQHEQVNNRLNMQQQPDNLNLNFSVPYMHQQNMHWCDLELSQQAASDSQKKQSLGWHLVLRFAQDSPDSFAIESYLNSDQLQLTLWAQHQAPLAKLHKHASLLREKLTQAGFKVESIQSKQGLPSKNQQQVHQSMIDVHT